MGWSRAHRQQLCEESGLSIGPAICATRVRDLRVGLNTQAVIELCRRVSSLSLYYIYTLYIITCYIFIYVLMASNL